MKSNGYRISGTLHNRKGGAIICNIAMKWKHYIFFTFACITSLLAPILVNSVYASKAYPKTNYAVHGFYIFTKNHQKLWVEKYGKGSPAIILLNGGGDSIRQWNSIIPALSKVTTVVGYDRQGLGNSPMSNKLTPLTAGEVASQINSILDQLKIRKPVVLVAHSIGGLYLSYYARKYPEKVAGIVSLDGNTSTQIFWSKLNLKKASMTNIGHLKFMEQHELKKELELQSQIQQLKKIKNRTKEQNTALVHDLEVLGKRESASQISHLGALPAVPSIAISQNSVSGLYVWHQTIKQFIEKIPCSIFYIVPHSGHYIMIDQPKITISAIKSVVNAVRNNHRCVVFRHNYFKKGG